METSQGPPPAAAQEPGQGNPKNDPPYLRIILVALAARVAISLIHPLTFPGPGEAFEQYALRIAAGHGFGPSGLLPPGYPYFLAAVFRTQGYAPHTLVLSQAILGALVTVPVLLLGKAIGLPRGSSYLAGLLVAIFPAAVVEARYPTPLPLTVLLFTTAAWLLLRRRPMARARDSLGAGLLLGAAILTRTGVVLPAMLLTLLPPFPPRSATGSPSKTEIWLSRGFVLAVAVLVTIPWSVRNTRMHGQPLLTETTWALRLRAATIPGTPPFHVPAGPREARRPDNLVVSDNGFALWNILGYAATQPGRLAKLWISRAGQFVSQNPASETRGLDPFPYRERAFRGAQALIWAFSLTLLLAWALLSRMEGERERALCAAALGFFGLGIVTGCLGDARQLAIPLLALPAARGLLGLQVSRASRTWSRGPSWDWRVRLFLAATLLAWALQIAGMIRG